MISSSQSPPPKMRSLETQLRHNRQNQNQLVGLMKEFSDQPETAEAIFNQYMKEVQAAAKLERQILAA